MSAARPITILMADDDEEDCTFTREALVESRLANDLHVVGDGAEVLDYLRASGAYAAAPPPRPDLILLDLNMPKLDGRQVLAELKGDPALRAIPVVVLTTSSAEEDIFRSYDLGASSFISKPVTFDGLVNVMRELGRYWMQIVELPERD
jgi:CheY-like chemotaxis protein